MKRSLTLALLALLALALAVPATAAIPEKAGGFGYFSLGSTPLDLTDLNDKLEANGYPAVANVISFGGGGVAFLDRLVLGGEGYGMFGRTVTDAGNVHNAKVDAGMGMFRLGYVVYQSETFRLYPMAGIGAGAVQLHIQNRAVPDFDSLLGTPGQEMTIEQAHLLLDLGFGADRLLTLGGTPQGEGHFVIGLRAGYIWSPASSEWRMGQSTVPGGPSVGFTGPYVRMVIGAGGVGSVVIPEIKVPETK